MRFAAAAVAALCALAYPAMGEPVAYDAVIAIERTASETPQASDGSSGDESPALAAFKGVESFPIREDFRVEARFEPYDPPKPIPIANIVGIVEDQPSPGAVVFTHGGKTWRLDALEGSDGELFLLFADATSGEETYGAGRFLDTKKPSNGKVVVDFNLAYNPPCVFTPYATCPLPPRQNRLAMRVEAGEKNYHGGGH